MNATSVSPLIVWAVCALVTFAPVAAARRVAVRTGAGALAVQVFVGMALAMQDGAAAYALLAGCTVLHAVVAWRRTRTGAAGLLLAAAATGVASVALAHEALDVAFVASLSAIALRAGVMPFHVGIAALTDRQPRLQCQQLGSMVPLVYLHLVFTDHAPLAVRIGPAIVLAGALTAPVPALLALVATDAKGWLRASTVMHAGMLFSGVGAACNGHYAAAIFEAVTLALALGGTCIVVGALEDRCGSVELTGLGGRVRSLPRLCAVFAVFGAAGVGLPATAGFIADDLLLHALWDTSQAAAVLIVVSTCLLAVATLGAWSKVFLGPPRPSMAEDLAPRERLWLGLLVVALLGVGLAPQVLMDPLTAVLRAR